MTALFPYLSHHWPVRDVVTDKKDVRMFRKSGVPRAHEAILQIPGIKTAPLATGDADVLNTNLDLQDSHTWFLIPRSIAKRSIATAKQHRDDVAALGGIRGMEVQKHTTLAGPVTLTKEAGGRRVRVPFQARGRWGDDSIIEMQPENAQGLILVAGFNVNSEGVGFGVPDPAGGANIPFQPTLAGPRGVHAPDEMLGADVAESELLAQFDTTQGPLDWLRGTSDTTRKGRLQNMLRNAKNRSKEKGITGADLDVAKAEVQYFTAMLAHEDYVMASEKKKLRKAVDARKKVTAQMKPGTPLMLSQHERVLSIREDLRKKLEQLDAAIQEAGMKDTAAGAFGSVDGEEEEETYANGHERDDDDDEEEDSANGHEGDWPASDEDSEDEEFASVSVSADDELEDLF